MKIILSQEDLDKAVCTYVTSLGMNLDNKSVNVDFTAGRGANGNTATVEILPLENTPELGFGEEKVSEEGPLEPSDNLNVFEQ